jgi:hypothetical protein
MGSSLGPFTVRFMMPSGRLLGQALSAATDKVMLPPEVAGLGVPVMVPFT